MLCCFKQRENKEMQAERALHQAASKATEEAAPEKTEKAADTQTNLEQKKKPKETTIR
jgi:hypothetical protein